MAPSSVRFLYGLVFPLVSLCVNSTTDPPFILHPPLRMGGGGRAVGDSWHWYTECRARFICSLTLCLLVKNGVFKKLNQLIYGDEILFDYEMKQIKDILFVNLLQCARTKDHQSSRGWGRSGHLRSATDHLALGGGIGSSHFLFLHSTEKERKGSGFILGVTLALCI